MTLMFQKEKLRHRDIAVGYPQGHGTCKWWSRAGTLICPPQTPFHYSFFHRAGVLRNEVSWRLPGTSPVVQGTPSSPACLSPTFGGIELVYTAEEASKLLFTKPGGSRRPELAERFNLGIFLLHKISFRTFGPLGLPQIANDQTENSISFSLVASQYAAVPLP